MTTSRWQTGLPAPDEQREIARAARQLPTEPMAAGVRVLFGASAVVWAVTLAIVFATLPERVPTHWSSETPDGWSSRWGALAIETLAPLALVAVLLGTTRLALRWPGLVNAPYKEYWLATPPRLRRFERLLREDMSVIAALSLLLFAALGVITGVAAHRPGGQMPEWVFALVTIAFVIAVLGVCVRILLGSRYRPRG